MKQFIYITGSTETNIYKIGLSSNPEQRVKTINGSSNQKNDYQKIYEVHNMNLSEKSLHLKFKEQRLNGEWFKLTQEDLDWIEENAAIYVDPRIKQIRLTDFPNGIKINSAEYQRVSKLLTMSQIGYLYSIASLIIDSTNIAKHEISGQPYTKSDLATRLDLLVDTAGRLLKKLSKINLIKVKTINNVKSIMVNPNFAMIANSNIVDAQTFNEFKI